MTVCGTAAGLFCTHPFLKLAAIYWFVRRPMVVASFSPNCPFGFPVLSKATLSQLAQSRAKIPNVRAFELRRPNAQGVLGPLEAHLVSIWPKLPKTDNHVYVFIEGCICIFKLIHYSKNTSLIISKMSDEHQTRKQFQK